MSVISDGICETLFFTQSSKYNKLYFLQAFLTFLYTMSLTLDEVFPWHEDIMKHIRMFFQVISVPVFTLSSPAFFVFWGVCLVFIIFAITCFAMLSRGLLSGDLERAWLGPAVRICMAVVGTFWITVTRTLYVRNHVLAGSHQVAACLQSCFSAHYWAVQVMVACQDEKSILLEDHSCTGAGVASLAVSITFIVVFWALYAVHTMTHEVSPLSFNALARTDCSFDFVHSFWLVAITTNALVNRPYYRDGVYNLNVPYAVAGCLIVGGAHQLYHLSMNQPYFDTRMNDLKAACSAGLILNGMFTMAISILYKIMENDHTGLGQGMQDFSEDIRLACTLAFLGLLPVSMLAGYRCSFAMRAGIVQRKLAGIQHLLEEAAIQDREAEDAQAQAQTSTKTKLVNATHNADEDKLWEQVHERFIPGLGITGQQQTSAVECEIASRFFLTDLMKRGHNFKSSRYTDYKNVAGDLFKAKTLFSHELNPRDTHENCQSVYLMIQYVRFCMAYSLMPPIVVAKKLEDIAERYSDEMSYVCWLVKWRLMRTVEILKRRETANEMQADGLSLGFEEVKKKQRAAMEYHKAALTRASAIWKFIETSGQTMNAHKLLYSMLEKVWQAEQGATEAYLYVLDKASADVETLHKFAVFQMTVKKDRKIATELKAVAVSIGDASMQSGESQGSAKGSGNRLEFLSEVRTNLTANALISKVQVQMSCTTVALVMVVTVLFTVYLVLINEYKQNLISLTESGARSYYSMALALNVRDMHAYAMNDDIQNWNIASQQLYANCREFSDRHVHLIHTFRTSYAEQAEFYRMPQEYINVKIPLAPSHLVSPGKAVRNSRLSGMDVAFRLIVSASEVQKSRPNDFLAFDAMDPASFAALWYVLENAHITAKAMDHSTIIYVYEATDIANMMAIVFIVLSAIAVCIEFGLVILIFRKNVNQLFDAMYNSSAGAMELIKQCGANKEIVPLIMSKNSKKGNKSDDAHDRAQAKAKHLTDDDEEVGSDKDEEQQQGETGYMEDETDQFDDEANGGSTDMSQVLLKLFYYTCLTLITGCLCTLCGLCFTTLSHAEASANDLNNGARRRYLDGRVLYLTKELLYSVNEGQSLVGGTFTLLNSTDLIRCMLRRAGYALLSSHYSLIYGGELGFRSLGDLQNWLGGDVKSWLPPGWNKPLPDQTQKYGYESPPKWSETGGDYCTPFTWSAKHFEKATEMKGSLGNSETQDSIYFTSNCFTDLELTDSIVLRDTRIKFFSDQMKPEQCYGYRSDIILCADMERQAHKYKPKPRVDRFEVEGCLDDEQVIACQDKISSGQQCLPDDFGAYQDCQEAERRRHCDLARRGPYKEKKCKLPPDSKGVQFNDPSCNPMIDFGNGRVKSRDGVQRDTELGISDLDFYNAEFKASFTHADIKPRDPIMTMGLHTLVNFFMDNAISISNDPIENINPDSTFFHRIYKYANGEIQSGQEIAGGLFKSILVAQHDVLTEMDNNTSVTIIAFVVIMAVVLMQLAFLSQRIKTVVINYFGITQIIMRMLAEVEESRLELEAREQEEMGFKGKNDEISEDGEQSDIASTEDEA